MSDLLISEHLGYRTLHFGSEWVQGRMRISRPAELALGYAQDMCAALLFVPPPKHVYVAGQGVGSLPRWAFAHWTETMRHMEIVELRADVMALAHSSFPLPLDDPRLTLTEIAFALGHGDQVVGVDTSSVFPPEVKLLPQVGYPRTLAAEGVLALRPTRLIAAEEAGPAAAAGFTAVPVAGPEAVPSPATAAAGAAPLPVALAPVAEPAQLRGIVAGAPLRLSGTLLDADRLARLLAAPGQAGAASRRGGNPAADEDRRAPPRSRPAANASAAASPSLPTPASTPMPAARS